MTPRPRLLTLKQAEQEFGLSYMLLYRLVKDKKLAGITPPGARRIYLDRADVEAAILLWKENA